MDADPHKYITFRRDELFDLLAQFGMKGDLTAMEIDDAVVIRRQDIFAAPALFAYAHSIAIAAKVAENTMLHDQLIRVSDYLHQQAELAGEEGHKFPDV